jgi:hypothetical protein
MQKTLHALKLAKEFSYIENPNFGLRQHLRHAITRAEYEQKTFEKMFNELGNDIEQMGKRLEEDEERLDRQ